MKLVIGSKERRVQKKRKKDSYKIMDGSKQYEKRGKNTKDMKRRKERR